MSEPFSVGDPNLSPLVAYGAGMLMLGAAGVVAGFVLAPYYDAKKSTVVGVAGGLGAAFGAMLTAIARSGNPAPVANFDAWPIDHEHYDQGPAPNGGPSYPGATAGWYDGQPIEQLIDFPPGTSPEVIERVMNLRYHAGMMGLPPNWCGTRAVPPPGPVLDSRGLWPYWPGGWDKC